jgi:hypothetical protein
MSKVGALVRRISETNINRKAKHEQGSKETRCEYHLV